MKRVIALCLVMLLCALTGCRSADDGFRLKKLPDIGKYQPAVRAERWYDTYVDTFIPSPDYGKLVPFLGRTLQFEGDSPFEDGLIETSTFDYYGLCTTEGKIVLEPVYHSIVEQNGCYVLYDVVDHAHPTLVIPTDGSAIRYRSDEPFVSAQVLSDGRVLAVVRRFDHSFDGEAYQLYDTDGSLLFTFPEYCEILEVGAYYLAANYMTSGYSVYDRGLNLRLYDVDLTKVGDYYIFCRDPYSGAACLGVMDADLREVLPPVYRYCTRLEDHYLLFGDALEVCDADLRLLRTVGLPAEEFSYWVTVDAYGDYIWNTEGGKYLKCEDDRGEATYIDADGNLLDEPPTFEKRPEEGENPLQYGERDGFYVTTYHGKAIVKIPKESF